MGLLVDSRPGFRANDHPRRRRSRLAARRLGTAALPRNSKLETRNVEIETRKSKVAVAGRSITRHYMHMHGPLLTANKLLYDNALVPPFPREPDFAKRLRHLEARLVDLEIHFLSL